MTIVPPKVSISAIGRTEAISNDALHSIALTGNDVGCDPDRAIKSVSDQPPVSPVMSETGPSSCFGFEISADVQPVRRKIDKKK